MVPLNGNLFPGVPLLDATALAGLSMFFVSVFKPFVEKVPFARVDASTHDATIRLLNLLVNAGLVLGLAATASTLSLSNWPTYLVTAVGQAIGSQALYSAATSSGGSIGSQSKTSK